MNPRNVRFTEWVHMTGKYQVCVCHAASSLQRPFCVLSTTYSHGCLFQPRVGNRIYILEVSLKNIVYQAAFRGVHPGQENIV